MEVLLKSGGDGDVPHSRVGMVAQPLSVGCGIGLRVSPSGVKGG